MVTAQARDEEARPGAEAGVALLRAWRRRREVLCFDGAKRCADRRANEFTGSHGCSRRPCGLRQAAQAVARIRRKTV